MLSAHAQSPYPDYNKTTTASQTHGYSQFSGDTFFNNMTIVTSGSQSDGVRTANWGPKITINNLDVTTTGNSADAINVSRDGEGTIVTVQDYAKIHTERGMGVRSTATQHSSGGTNQIIFNGSSSITTTGNGDRDNGHAVFAGNNINGCGPSGLPVFDCRASNSANISLLGTADDLHVISTAGANAHAVYAYGRGFIDLGNVDITTTGNGANGIYAQRRSSRYYFNSSTGGQQDFSGTVRLTGNTSITSTGSGSYALIADSFDELDGADSEGNHARIYTDISNGISEPIYNIHGNMHATKSGIIDLTMGDHSTFTGSSSITQNGDIKLDITGSNSRWNLTGDSSLTHLKLSNGAVLRPQKNDALPINYTLTGSFQIIGGIIDLSDNIAGDVLTIKGDYVGSNDAALVIDTFLGGSGASSDRILNDGGTISGQTLVRINNIDVSDTGAETEPGQGVKIVRSVNGGTTVGDAFALDSNAQNAYEHNGRTVVGAGAFAYGLYKGASPTNTSTTDEYGEENVEHDWYLRSQLNETVPGVPTDPVDPVDPTDPIEPDAPWVLPPPVEPLYQAGVPSYEAYPQALLGLNGLSSLQQRVGNRFWMGAGNQVIVQGADAIASPYAPPQEAGTLVNGNGMWGRIEGAHNKIDPRFSTSNTEYNQNVFKLQAGVDGMLTENDNGTLIGGVFVQYVHGKTKTKSVHGDGEISTDGYGLGGTLTWYGNEGFYVDAQAQATWYDSDLSSRIANLDFISGNDGFGYALSLETGKRIAIDPTWSVTPQAQLVYSNVDFDSFTDVFGAAVSLDRGESLQGRLGITLDHANSWQNALGMTDRTHIYGIANLYYEFMSGTRVDVAGTSFASEKERLWGGIGLGGSYNWNDDKYSIYGEGIVDTSLNNFGDSYAFKGNVGFRVKW